MNNKNLSVFFAASCIFIWGITFVSTKYLLKSFNAIEILVLRFLIAYAAFWIMHPVVLKLPERKQEIYFLLAGFFGVTFYQFVENMSIFYTEASNVSIIVSVCPMITAIVAQLFLKEKHITFFFIIGFIIAMSGIVLVALNGSLNLHLSPKGDLLAFGAACSWAFYSLFVSKISRLELDPVCCTRRSFFWALVFMIPIVFAGSFLQCFQQISFNFDLQLNRERFFDFKNIFNLLFLSVGASAYCFVAWNLACKNLGTVKTTLGIYLSPVVTIVFAFLCLGEKITLMGLSGAFLTIIGLLLSRVRGNN